ncbi:MAG: flippase [Fusobacterium gastrosuis]|uniref:flippase n=1 Tax=Fusobacterium gastrosuis TaxID=1755100 RepID=UPI002A8D009A|nr:flippase [Fusobacterium gastrosuis]
MKIVKNYLYNILGLLTGSLFPLIIFPYISRILAPQYLGYVTFTQSIANYFIVLATLGVPIYGIRELAIYSNTSKIENEKFSEKAFELFFLTLISSTFSTLLYLILVFKIEKMFQLKNLFFILAFQIFFSFINFDYVFIVLEKHKRRSIRSIFLRLISGMLILIFVKKPQDYSIYLVILVFSEILLRIFDVYSLRKLYFRKLKLKNLELKRHLKPLLVIFIYIFSVGVYINIDTTMLGFLKSEKEVGFYTSGSKLIRMLIPLISVLGTVMAPDIVKNINKNQKKELYQKIDNFIDFSMIIGLPLAIYLMYFSKEIIVLLSGNNFLEGNKVLIIMGVMVIFQPIATFFGGQLLLPNKKENIILKIALLGMVLNIILNSILIPKYSISGAALATLLTEIIIFFFRNYEVKKIYFDYNFFIKRRVYYLIEPGILFFLLIILTNKFYLTQFYIIILGGIYFIIHIFFLYLYKDINIRKLFYIFLNIIKRNKAMK